MTGPAAPEARAFWFGVAGLVGALVVGALAALVPEAVLVLLAVLVGAGLLPFVARRARSPFCLTAFAIVGGYIALSRWFAGLRLPIGNLPLYIGELALLVLLVPALRRLHGRQLDAPALLLLVWMAYNAVLTVLQLPTYGLDAIRDAATWYYGLFAVIGAAVWREVDTNLVRRWFMLCCLVTFGAVIGSNLTDAGVLPQVQLPFSDTLLFSLRFDATSMHLVGAVVLFLTGQRLAQVPWPRWLAPLLAAAALGLVATLQVRAAFVGLVGGLALLLLYRLWKPVCFLVGLLAAVIGLFWLVNFEVSTSRGVVSAQAVIDRQVSTILFVNGEDVDPHGEQAGTIYWRVVWWQALIDDALANPEILLIGRGYGADLTEPVAGLTRGLSYEQGSAVGRPLRSPHSILLTLLGRSGLVGLVLWLLLLAACFQRIIRGTLAARRVNDLDNELFGVWVASYLVIILLVSSFGVVLESPFGAGPFFLILGLAVAWASDLLARQSPASRSVPASPADGLVARRSPIRSGPRPLPGAHDADLGIISCES